MDSLEIAYSVRTTRRGSYTSHSNAVLAVVLPDRRNSYAYFENINLFKILKENIQIEYIPVVNWENFKYNCDYYLEKAIKAKNLIPNDKIKKQV